MYHLLWRRDGVNAGRSVQPAGSLRRGKTVRGWLKGSACDRIGPAIGRQQHGVADHGGARVPTYGRRVLSVEPTFGTDLAASIRRRTARSRGRMSGSTPIRPRSDAACYGAVRTRRDRLPRQRGRCLRRGSGGGTRTRQVPTRSTRCNRAALRGSRPWRSCRATPGTRAPSCRLVADIHVASAETRLPTGREHAGRFAGGDATVRFPGEAG